MSTDVDYTKGYIDTTSSGTKSKIKPNNFRSYFNWGGSYVDYGEYDELCYKCGAVDDDILIYEEQQVKLTLYKTPSTIHTSVVSTLGNLLYGCMIGAAFCNTTITLRKPDGTTYSAGMAAIGNRTYVSSVLSWIGDQTWTIKYEHTPYNYKIRKYYSDNTYVDYPLLRNDASSLYNLEPEDGLRGEWIILKPGTVAFSSNVLLQVTEVFTIEVTVEANYTSNGTAKSESNTIFMSVANWTNEEVPRMAMYFGSWIQLIKMVLTNCKRSSSTFSTIIDSAVASEHPDEYLAKYKPTFDVSVDYNKTLSGKYERNAFISKVKSTLGNGDCISVVNAWDTTSRVNVDVYYCNTSGTWNTDYSNITSDKASLGQTVFEDTTSLTDYLP